MSSSSRALTTAPERRPTPLDAGRPRSEAWTHHDRSRYKATKTTIVRCETEILELSPDLEAAGLRVSQACLSVRVSTPVRPFEVLRPSTTQTLHLDLRIVILRKGNLPLTPPRVCRLS